MKYKISIQVLFRLILIFISIEFAIRLAEINYYFISDKLIKNNINVDHTAYRIICIGESTVAGHGASDFNLGRNHSQKSFPAQLKKMLHEHFPEKKIQVFNLGICGVNSKVIYRNLKPNLKYFSPNLVIFLVGNNTFTLKPVFPLFRPLILSVKLNNLKTVSIIRLARYIYDAYKSKKETNFSCRPKILNRIYESYNKDLCAAGPYSNYETWEYCSKILNFLKREKYNILVCNYFNSNANTYLKNIAQELKLPFCDNKTIYDNYEKSGITSEILSADGWHPNDKGYYLMAENISNKIIEERVIENK